MLEDRPQAQPQHAGSSSNLTREVVPTSDDEDLFFLSQSSDKYGSSSSSAQTVLRSDDGVEQDEEDEEEAILPTRPLLAQGRDSQQPNIDPAVSSQARATFHVDSTREPASPIHSSPSASIAVDETPASPPDPTSRPHAERPVDRTAPSTALASNPATPLSSIAPNPPAVTRSLQDAWLPTSNGELGGDTTISPKRDADPSAADDEGDDTIRHAIRSISPTQQSDITLPISASPAFSRPVTPEVSSSIVPNHDGLPRETERMDDSPGSIAAQVHEDGREEQVSMDLDGNGELYDQSAADAQASLGETETHADMEHFSSSTPPLPSLRLPGRHRAPRSPSVDLQPLTSHIPNEARPTENETSSNIGGPSNHADVTLNDEHVARAAAAQPPTPPRRNLRARKAAQLNPYTLEAMRYQRALIRNDWEDAVVSQREWHRQERRRLAEEAARAEREGKAAQGSEESQSQWLIPSSGASSQADHYDVSAPSSSPARTGPEVFVEIPPLDPSDRMHASSSSSRHRRPPPSPSPNHNARPPEPSETQGGSTSNAPLRSNGSRPVPSKHATYKGPRTTAQSGSNAQSEQPQSNTEDSQINDEDVAPLPAPLRRKQPLRALSPSDDEAPVAMDQHAPMEHDSFIVESSEDERPVPTAPIPKPKRRSRWSGDGSSSDSTDYERRFRQLKKMMPAGMARKHIRDLRAMRHGKAYHSDGHVSSSSSEGRNTNSNDRSERTRARHRDTDASHIAGDDEDLQPGQTRKRLRRHDSTDATNALLLDPDSESSSSSASSLSSDESVAFTHSISAGPRFDRDRDDRFDEAEEVDEAPAAWWSVSRLDSYVPYRERDAIDRMLSRTGGRKPASSATYRRPKGVSQHRQARLDGFVSAHRHRERQADSFRSHLREIDPNQRRQQRTTLDVKDQDVSKRSHKRKKKKRKLDPRVGRTTSSSTRSGPAQLRNPPVVRPRVRPRLDLEQHDLLFAANPVKSLAHRRGADAEVNVDDADSSGDEGQWQALGTIITDSTPAALPDARLAIPRSRHAVLPQQAPSLASTHDAAASPARNAHASPSVSMASAGLARLNAVNDRSPGTPTRIRGDAIPHQVPRPHAGQVASASTIPTSSSSDPWDDFEGISLDFGMAPLDEERRMLVSNSSLMARLSDLVALPDRLLQRDTVPRTWSGDVLRLDDTVLTTDMDHNTLASTLPFYMDNLRLEVGRALDQGDNGDGVDARRHSRRLMADTGAFLGCWMVRQTETAADGFVDAASIFRSYRTILERFEHLQTSVLSLHDSTLASRGSREDRKLICLQLAWMRFELCWRAMAICDMDANHALEPDAPTVESLLAFSRALMSLLLHHGLHRSIRNLRKAVAAGSAESSSHSGAMELDQDEDASSSIDEATSMWLGVIHLLDSFEKNRGIMDGKLFWTQFEMAYHRWDESMPERAPLLRSESLWYCLFAISTLSQISTSGQTLSAPTLKECWPLAARALSLVKFRSEESNEMTMGWHMLAKRDAYVRIVLQRCCLLSSEWRWTMDGAEVTLARLFDIFNSHKLADLPTETEHDFPAFLRDFDVDKLSTANVTDAEAMQDPSFHLFVRLLARAGLELRASVAEAKEGDRRISRLFSRMTPVRVMPFTRNDVPTSSQRSVLFNHYTVVMLFLHLVPASSPQRLRQIQSFLPAFKEADFLSQVTCVRAMMYVAVIFRHHRLELTPVTRWFGDTITVLRREYEEIETTTKQYERQQLQQSLQHRAARPDTLRMASIFENAPARQAALRRKEEVARLLVVALRSIQHVIRHTGLEGESPSARDVEERLPDQLLLSAAWTQQMLEAQIALEPRIGQEVLKCIQTFLLARIRVLQPAARTETKFTALDGSDANLDTGAHPPQPNRDEESQDSFAELFEADDDFDFEDPLLARLLDGADTGTAVDGGEAGRQTDATMAADTAASEKKRWDREFGELVKNTISPSLFQLLSNIYHPDRRLEAATTGSVLMSLGVTERLTEPCFAAGQSSTSRTRMDRLLKAAEARQYVELVVDCWAGCAQVLVTNGLREWSSYLGFGNESWKRIDDATGRRDVGLRFLQNVVSLDPAAVHRREYEVEFLAVWVQTAVARVLSVQDVYTKSLIDAAPTGQDSLLSSLAAQWRTIIDASAEPAKPVELDLDSFSSHRASLLATTYAALAASLAAGKTSMGTAYSIVSALLSSLRAYVDDAPGAAADYLEFCRTTLSDLEGKMEGTSVMGSLKGEFGAVQRLVASRLEAVSTG